MKPIAVSLPCLLVLVACSSPPKPPMVDESDKRPANAAVAVELQVCRAELQNTRILALENARAAQTSGSTVARLIQQQARADAQALQTARAAADPATAPNAANKVVTIHFDYGSTQLSLPVAVVRRIADDARDAPLVVLRGRTDGSTDAAAESRIARQRAEAVRELLLQAGIAPTRIRTTWQPSGDRIADNGSPSGRSLNRRVEVEIYRAAPQAMALRALAQDDAFD